MAITRARGARGERGRVHIAVMLALVVLLGGLTAAGLVRQLQPQDEQRRSTSEPLLGGTVYENPGESARQAFERVRTTYGGELGAVRIYYPELPERWDTIRASYGKTPMVVSFKIPPREVLAGAHDAWLRSWFAAAPRDYDIWWSYWHEPENDQALFDAESYRAAWRHVEALADSTRPARRLHATLTLMCWTVREDSGRDWRDYYPGDDVVDTFAFDCFNSGSENGEYRDVEEMLAPAVEVARSLGKPWGVAEVGSLLADGDDGRGRAAWLRSLVEFAATHEADFVTYFDSRKTNDYRLLDAASRQTWRRLVSAHAPAKSQAG